MLLTVGRRAIPGSEKLTKTIINNVSSSLENVRKVQQVLCMTKDIYAPQ